MSPVKIRSQVLKLSQLSAYKPNYYFIQGYFIGLALLPNLVLPSQWQADLFGTITLSTDEQTEYFDSVYKLYQQQLDKVNQNQLKMPAQCALSKENYQESLNTDMPLPSYCNGILKALNFIDLTLLDAEQNKILMRFKALVTSFTSVQAAERHTQDSDYSVYDFKRIYIYLAEELASQMCFANFNTDAQIDSVLSNLNQEPEPSEFESLFTALLADTSLEALPAINELLNIMHSTIFTSEFIDENAGNFWRLSETRPYMSLRAHRAKIHALHGQLEQAQSELEYLLYLNPNDEQGNRLLLINCYFISKNYEKLEPLVNNPTSNTLHSLASKILFIYAQQGDCAEAQRLKALMLQANKYFAKILTGQLKVKPSQSEYCLFGSPEEVEDYLDYLGKQAWIAIPGSLFWLRKS